MSESVAFVIPGDAVAKGRPRVTRNGHAYTPEKTQNYETLVKWLATQAMRGRQRFNDEPLSLEVRATLQIPVSWTHKRRQAALKGHILPTCRPDADNLLKAILDAGNGIIYRDDSLICELYATKRYGPVPQTEVLVSAIELTNKEVVADEVGTGQAPAGSVTN